MTLLLFSMTFQPKLSSDNVFGHPVSGPWKFQHWSQ